MDSAIEIIGDRENNLKNINVHIPHNSLTVITGVSGSGKSSLGYNTIFAEGQRRYLQTFSNYARSFIGIMKRPDVDSIKGLQPVIAIDQHTLTRNSRSTVGTTTEIYDLLRLLFAKIGIAYSYITEEPMVQRTQSEIINDLKHQFANQQIIILAPLINNRKGHYKELLETYRRKGYVLANIDNNIVELVPGLKLNRYEKHSIDIVIDKIFIDLENIDEQRLEHSVSTAFDISDNIVSIRDSSNQTYFYSTKRMCPHSGISYPDPSPFNFSFNSPLGWCPTCLGLGKIPKKHSVHLEDNENIDSIINSDDWVERIKTILEQQQNSIPANSNIDSDEGIFFDKDELIECPTCLGKRLNKIALHYKVANKTIDQWTEMDMKDLFDFCTQVYNKLPFSNLSSYHSTVAEPILKEMLSRLGFLLSIGLDYLKLSLPTNCLSGGENQRIRLASQLSSNLTHTLFILDEPSIGLHQRDNDKLIKALQTLRDKNNTVIVIEHDEQIMRQADYIVDLGPGAGRQGGQLLFQGPVENLLKSNTLTAQYLNGTLPKSVGHTYEGNTTPSTIQLLGCHGNNLKDIDVTFPLHRLIGVSGVSGSGKSTLINNTLYPILIQHLYKSKIRPFPYKKIIGIENIDKVIQVDQSPIGKNPRSTPATYTGIFNDIRELFAQLPDSKIRAWSAKHFSYNLAEGRCPQCEGYGYKTQKLFFLPDTHVLCENCNGKRYNEETLQILFKNKSIADILDMTIQEASEFFVNQPSILRKLVTLNEVGLGYLKLGQPANTLSGGENQRVKMASELAKKSTGKTLFILDEPTTGLHFKDIQLLLRLLFQLVQAGNTVIVIEHNLDVLRCCDYIIDLGPEGGKNGGQIVACGTIEQIKGTQKSITAKYL